MVGPSNREKRVGEKRIERDQRGRERKREKEREKENHLIEGDIVLVDGGS